MILQTFYPTEATDRTCWTIQTHSDELHCARRRTFHELNSLRALPFNQKVWFEFRQLPVTSGTAFSKMSKERTTSRGIPKFSETFTGIFFPFNFAPGISRIYGWMVRISEIQQFFLYHLPLFPIFRKFWLTRGSALSEKFDFWPRP